MNHFFGLTHLGPPSYFGAERVSNFNCTDIDEETFQQAFMHHLPKGASSQDVDNTRLILTTAYGTSPPEIEVKFLLDYFRRWNAKTEERLSKLPPQQQQQQRQEKAGPPLVSEVLQDAYGDSTAFLSSSLSLPLRTSIPDQVKREVSRIDVEKELGGESARLAPLEQGNIQIPYTPVITPELSMTAETFMQAIKEVRAFVKDSLSHEGVSAEYKSGRTFRDAQRRHTRGLYNPQEKFRAPVTTSMDYGWFVPANAEKQVIRNKKLCAETQFQSNLIQSGVLL